MADVSTFLWCPKPAHTIGPWVAAWVLFILLLTMHLYQIEMRHLPVKRYPMTWVYCDISIFWVPTSIWWSPYTPDRDMIPGLLSSVHTGTFAHAEMLWSNITHKQRGAVLTTATYLQSISCRHLLGWSVLKSDVSWQSLRGALWNSWRVFWHSSRWNLLPHCFT